jgi:adenylate kinase
VVTRCYTLQVARTRPNTKAKVKRTLTLNLIGPPGSGKGTQAGLLAKKLNLVHFVPGQMLREEIRKRTALGKRIKRTISRGHLVSDRDMLPILVRFLDSLAQSQGVVIDGFPRRISQKKLFDRLIISYGRTPVIIYVGISPKTSFKRLAHRQVCAGCGSQPISKKFTISQCKKCGGKIVTRLDDQPDVVRERLRVDRAQAQPVVAAYRREKRLVEIDGEKSVVEVQRSIVAALRKLGYN